MSKYMENQKLPGNTLSNWFIVGFCIHDRNGTRVVYGTRPLKGDVDVAPN
jgi:hypothetical protein